jgi:phosphoheptose isomerase
MKGDTSTGLAVEGSREFHVVSIVKLVGLSYDEAKEMVLAFAPVGESTAVYRLCRECANKTGAKVVGLAGESSLPGYSERTMFPDGFSDEDE